MAEEREDTAFDRGNTSQGTRRQADRQQAITEMLLASGSVRIDQIVAEFGVSRMTIHRDLDALEARGVLRRSHGSVTALSSSQFESTLEYRIRQNIDIKEAIARTAVELVEPGQSVVLDDSTTGLALARLLPQHGPVTIVTNFRRVLNELVDCRDVSLIATGGEYVQTADAYKGAVALNALQNLSTDIYFMSTPAITGSVCYHQNQELVLVKQAMFACARVRVLVVDHTKFHRRALHSMARVSTFDHAVVDSLTAPDHIAMLQDAGVRVHIAPPVRMAGRRRSPALA